MEKNLYRIVPIKALLSLLMFKTERFVSPFSWEDTFEGCALRYDRTMSDVDRFCYCFECIHRFLERTSAPILAFFFVCMQIPLERNAVSGYNGMSPQLSIKESKGEGFWRIIWLRGY